MLIVTFLKYNDTELYILMDELLSRLVLLAKAILLFIFHPLQQKLETI
jgi:hypothetical protein